MENSNLLRQRGGERKPVHDERLRPESGGHYWPAKDRLLSTQQTNFVSKYFEHLNK